MILDNFLVSYKELKAYSLKCDFIDEINPIDGVVYPLICKDIPESVISEITSKLSEFLGRETEQITIFMRMSPKGADCPHLIHHDGSMGKYSLMLYLNSTVGGTALVRHTETGITYAPNNQIFVNIITYDQNNVDAWQEYERADMKENRAFIFDAQKLHCALPIGGFGENQKDSRIVLTCFFS